MKLTHLAIISICLQVSFDTSVFSASADSNLSMDNQTISQENNKVGKDITESVYNTVYSNFSGKQKYLVRFKKGADSDQFLSKKGIFHQEGILH